MHSRPHRTDSREGVRGMERGLTRGVFAPLASQGQVGERPAPGPIGRRSKGCGSTVVTLLRWSLNPHDSVIEPRLQPEEIYAVGAAADPGARSANLIPGEPLARLMAAINDRDVRLDASPEGASREGHARLLENLATPLRDSFLDLVEYPHI